MLQIQRPLTETVNWHFDMFNHLLPLIVQLNLPFKDRLQSVYDLKISILYRQVILPCNYSPYLTDKLLKSSHCPPNSSLKQKQDGG